MASLLKSAVVYSYLLNLATALPWIEARKTAPIDDVPRFGGFSPQPTTSVAAEKLFDKRQAYPATSDCGYISGSSALSPTATAHVSRTLWSQNGIQTPLPTEQQHTPSNERLTINNSSYSDSPYCYTFSFTDLGYSVLGCSSEAGVFADVQHTYSGESPHATATLTSSYSYSSSSTSSSSSSTYTSSTTTTSTASQSAGTSNLSSDEVSSVKNTAVIIGGVVGGVMLLTIIIAVCLLICCLRKRKQRKAAIAAAQLQQQQQQMGPQQGFFDPQQQQQQQQQAYPMNPQNPTSGWALNPQQQQQQQYSPPYTNSSTLNTQSQYFPADQTYPHQQQQQQQWQNQHTSSISTPSEMHKPDSVSFMQRQSAHEMPALGNEHHGAMPAEMDGGGVSASEPFLPKEKTTGAANT
ncbi:MAG: hypothetical protein M1834_006092 [Cirrosporium novae-zelandiae]|nr:MAG: hypothetical protein M1834_006092 [Cirrosporium novae-zelandiae]